MSNDVSSQPDSFLTGASVGACLPVLDWIVQHAEQSPAILVDLESIVSGATIADKWSALKSLGDLLVADLASFPTLDLKPAEADEAALRAFAARPVVKANGAIINTILQNLPQIVAAIQSILSLLKG